MVNNAEYSSIVCVVLCSNPWFATMEHAVMRQQPVGKGDMDVFFLSELKFHWCKLKP